jgi:hypothetical protein
METIVGQQKKTNSFPSGANYYAQVRKRIKMVLEIRFILESQMVIYRQKKSAKFSTLDIK